MGVTYMGATIMVLGTWILQDGLASIAFYPKESWRWNHTARVVRIGIGIYLVFTGAILL